MRILVTNDDGIDAPGLRILAGALAADGHEVMVVAPDKDFSGAGTQLHMTEGVPIPVRRFDVPELPGVSFAEVAGSPALATLLSRLGAFGATPRCVVSGINAGENTGRSVLHSGTVGAALTAASMGMSALAVSVAADRPRHYETAADMAVVALRWLAGARKRTVLNLNVPDVPIDAVRGVRWGRLAAYGSTRAILVENAEDHVTIGTTAGTLPLDPDTDAGLVAAGYAVVTPLVGPRAEQDGSAADGIASLLGSPSTVAGG